MNESNLSEIVDDGLDTMQTPPLGETNTGDEKGVQGSGTDEGKTKGKGGSKDLGSSINKVVGNLDGELEQGSLKNKVVVEKRNKEVVGEGLQVTRGVCRHTCLRGGSCRCNLDLSGRHISSLVLCPFCLHALMLYLLSLLRVLPQTLVSCFCIHSKASVKSAIFSCPGCMLANCGCA